MQKLYPHIPAIFLDEPMLIVKILNLEERLF